MSDVEYVCAKCGSDRIDVAFTANGSGSASVGTDSKGNPYVEHVEDKDYDNFDYETFSCADCNARWYPLAKGVAPKRQAGSDLNPGDGVWLPDGLKAVVATVDREANTFTVENWHETFKAGEGTPIEPMLRVAA